MRSRSSGIGFTGLLTLPFFSQIDPFHCLELAQGASFRSSYGRAQYCSSSAMCYFREAACSVARCTEQCFCSTAILASEELNPA